MTFVIQTHIHKHLLASEPLPVASVATIANSYVGIGKGSSSRFSISRSCPYHSIGDPVESIESVDPVEVVFCSRFSTSRSTNSTL